MEIRHYTPYSLIFSSLHSAKRKKAFRDALCLRYGWQPFFCLQFGFVENLCLMSTLLVAHLVVFLQLNKMNYMISLLLEVCHNVRTEPPLQPLSGEQFITGLQMLKMVTALMSELRVSGDRIGRWHLLI